MPSRQIAATELAEIFRILAHSDRIRMIEELRAGEKDVGGLARVLGLETPRISQHLRLLKAHKIVAERREGRHHFYRLTNPEMAEWIVHALDFVKQRHTSISTDIIKDAKRLWSK